MRHTGKLVPTEEYPKILYYVTAMPPLTVDEREDLFDVHVKNIKKKLGHSYTAATQERLLEMAIAKAKITVEEAIKKRTNFKKVVVNNFMEEQDAKILLEKEENFLFWA